MPSLYIPRSLPLPTLLNRTSVLLLGARRLGKSSLIRNELQPSRVYNLLESDTFQQLAARPSLIREGIKKTGELIAIDEIQKLPSLMDEVHTMIEDHAAKFILTGSSARKLMRTFTKLMGGRAKTVRLHPFSFSELESFDLHKALLSGTIPPIYLSEDPWEVIRSYVSDYIREEVIAEGLSRRVEQFSRFIDASAFSHTQELNYEEIGRDTQVPARTIRDYYDILSDTLFGETIQPFKGHPSRKATAHGKFYFFDIAVPHGICKVKELSIRSPQYGVAFEHLVYRELATYRDYRSPDTEITFYRDTSKREIDFMIDDQIAIEVKSTELVHDRDLKTISTVGKELQLKRLIVVSNEKNWRKVGAVEIVPVLQFLRELWAGDIF
jgi:predicted AAA+ superfamily ATPase